MDSAEVPRTPQTGDFDRAHRIPGIGDSKAQKTASENSLIFFAPSSILPFGVKCVSVRPIIRSPDYPANWQRLIAFRFLACDQVATFLFKTADEIASNRLFNSAWPLVVLPTAYCFLACRFLLLRRRNDRGAVEIALARRRGLHQPRLVGKSDMQRARIGLE